MGYVTPEQISQAKEIDLLTYLQQYDPHQLVHVGGNTYVKGRRQPTHVRLEGASCGLSQDSTVLLEQLRTLDKTRLGEYVGSVDKDKMRELDTALSISVGLVETYH